MAYLYQRPDGRIEIREAHASERGPRSRTLVSFRGALTPEHLDRAEARATRPLDRAALRARARARGVPVREAGAAAAARSLLARLRRGDALDPDLAAVLREALAPHAAPAVPAALAEVSEWLGASDAERGEALRDVLRLYGTVADSREPVRQRPAPGFPRFRSRAREAVG
jgi:hypothetical protein